MKQKKHFNTGKVPWNKGLTTKDHRVKKNIDNRTKTVKEKGTFALENNPQWKGGKSAYKNMALKHYGRRCMNCGKIDEREKYIHVHHRDHDRSNNHIENLEVLCAKCHKTKHPRKATDYQKQRASETNKGKITTNETKKRMSEARKLWWKNHK